MGITVTELAKLIGAELAGKSDGQITAVGTIEAANTNEVSFIADDKHLAKIKDSKAGAFIVSERIEGLNKPQLVVKDVNAALIKALKLFAPKLKPPVEGIDSTAIVSKNARIADGVSIGPAAVVEEGVEIGRNSVIAPGCKIGQNSTLGENCRLDSNVVIYHNCRLGNNVIIKANSTIGSDGFGYRFIDGAHRHIPHNGGVVIEDFVEVGANCCVDRAKFGNTVIGAGTKIDNLVQIAHNVIIGKCCLIVGQAGIGGSAKLGDGVVMAGRSGVVDNIEIGDKVIVAANSIVTHNLPAGKQVFGTPAYDHKKAFKVISLTRRLPEMVQQLKQLSKRLEELETAKDDKK